MSSATTVEMLVTRSCDAGDGAHFPARLKVRNSVFIGLSDLSCKRIPTSFKIWSEKRRATALKRALNFGSASSPQSRS